VEAVGSQNFGFAFNRRIEYESTKTEVSLSDGLLLQTGWRYSSSFRKGSWETQISGWKALFAAKSQRKTL